MSNHILPVPDYCVTTQTFAEHEATARKNGWCTRPGSCASGIYYYPALDIAPTWSDIDKDIPVFASADFVKIEYAGWDYKGKGPKGGYGIYVKGITADGEEVIFGHLADMPMVETGAKNVKQGTQLGWMGSTGNSSGKHLHWEIRVNGIPVDPETKMVGTQMNANENGSEPANISEEFAGAAVIALEGEEYQVISEYVNKRSEPSTGQGTLTVIGRIEEGEVVKPKRIIIYEGWMDLGDSYCAMVYQGNVYLAKKG